jgi:hypothetical protein
MWLPTSHPVGNHVAPRVTHAEVSKHGANTPQGNLREGMACGKSLWGGSGSANVYSRDVMVGMAVYYVQTDW